MTVKPVTSVENGDWRPPLPPLPKTTRTPEVDLSWQQRGEDEEPLPCVKGNEFERYAFAECDREADEATADALADQFCAHCPVADECIAFGRLTRAYGVYGGYMLIAGRTLPEHRKAARMVKNLAKAREKKADVKNAAQQEQKSA